MAFDYFTIQALAVEMRTHLLGAVVGRAYAKDNELAFSVAGADDWFYGRAGRDGLMCLRRENWPRDWSAGSGPEKYLVRARIVDIEADRQERIMRFRLERRDSRAQASYGVLICQLIPHKIQFFLLREETSEILGHWGQLRGPSTIGSMYSGPVSAGRLLPGVDQEADWIKLLEGAEGDLEKQGRRWLCGADAHVVRELLHRAKELGDEKTAMWSAAVEAYGTAPTVRAYTWEESSKMGFSALEPRRLAGNYGVCDGVSQVIWTVREAEREKQKSQRKDQQVKNRLKQALKNGGRRLKSMQLELQEADKAEDCEKKGNALLAHIAQLSAGSTQVELPDVFDPEGRKTLTIKLDPDRSPAENAARYLKSVKKYRRRQQIVPQRLHKLQVQCDRLNEWIEAVEAGTWQDNEALRNWLEATVKQSDKKGKEAAIAHPRRYRTSSGWSVWAGRNNKENDILSHKMSAQNDLWFHAHGYPGSHVVLRREGRKEEPDKQTLEEAAAVAAFWSKGKTAKKVSVVYTLVKYVSKPRGGAPGQAILKREKTIVVVPALIKEDQDDT